MDQVIREIIDIDKETFHMKQAYEELLREKESNLRKTLANLEKNFIGEDINKQTTANIDVTAELKHLEDACAKNMQNMDEVYKRLKAQLIENIWNDLF